MLYTKRIILWMVFLGCAKTGMLQERLSVITCDDDPQPPRNGDVVVKNKTVGSFAQTRCKPGYYRSGTPPFNSVCKEDGQWSDVNVKCIAQSCVDPGTPHNGKRLGLLFNYLDTVRFTCDKGYVLNGPSSRRCQDNQTWSQSQPRCEPISCGEPPKVQHAVPLAYGSSMDYVFGNRILYECLPGFKRIEDKFIICREDGKWYGTTPQCREIRCPQLKSPLNGRLLAGHNYQKEGGSVRYHCHAGYTLFGPNIRTCLKIERWTGPEPICFKCAEVGTRVFIRKPYYFKPGVVQSKAGNTVTVQYKDEEEETIVILGRGTQHYIIVEDRIPSANEIFVGSRVLAWNSRLRHFMFATVVFVSGSYFSVRYDGQHREQGKVTHRDIRTLEPPRFCSTCNDPGRPPHSSREEDLKEFIPGMEVIYTCEYTYKMSGSETRRCLANGTWTGTPPSCTAYSCDELDAFPPKNGKRIGDNFTIGNTVEFTCSDGYFLTGQKSLKCLANGKWSDFPPSCPSVCENYQCPSPGEKCIYDKSVGRRCVCRQDVECNALYEPVCGSDGVSYNSHCILSATACRTSKNIRMVQRGRCSPGGLCQIVPFSLCRGFFPGFFYNSTSTKCQYFIAGGCHRSGWNGFSTEKQCNQKCLVDICKQPAYPGPCSNMQKRWFFDSFTGKCNLFSYGGCYGNENNFATKDLCHQRCPPIKKVSGDQCRTCPRVQLHQTCQDSTLAIMAKVISKLPSDRQNRILRYVIDVQHVFKNTTHVTIPEGRVIVSIAYQTFPDAPPKDCACPRLPLNKKFIVIGQATTGNSKTGFILARNAFVSGWSLGVRRQIKIKCTDHVIIPNNIR